MRHVILFFLFIYLMPFKVGAIDCLYPRLGTGEYDTSSDRYNRNRGRYGGSNRDRNNDDSYCPYGICNGNPTPPVVGPTGPKPHPSQPQFLFPFFQGR